MHATWHIMGPHMRVHIHIIGPHMRVHIHIIRPCMHVDIHIIIIHIIGTCMSYTCSVHVTH